MSLTIIDNISYIFWKKQTEYSMINYFNFKNKINFLIGLTIWISYFIFVYLLSSTKASGKTTCKTGSASTCGSRPE